MLIERVLQSIVGVIKRFNDLQKYRYAEFTFQLGLSVDTPSA
jgi:hypothetical protein